VTGAVTIEALRAVGFVSPLDVHFARALGRLGGEERADVLLAAALVSRQVGSGHVCLDLQRLVETAPGAGAGDVLPDAAWPKLQPWLDGLGASRLVSTHDVVAPLVLDARGRLYLRRYWEHEQRLGAALRARALHTDASVDGVWLRQALDRLFPPRDGTDEIDWQRMAALLALHRGLCVISGGPGTGKTFTVVKILALLAEHAWRRTGRSLRMTLLAPTGKAAARLSEAIRRNKGGLDCTDVVKQAIPEEAATIHRCLGSIGGSSTRFRHTARTPLVTDVVLVDEASMVDLALMARLLDAVPPTARVILLGDQDQLASVEAGAVLGDICNTGAPRAYSHALVDSVAALTGDRLPVAADAPASSGIWDCIVELKRTYRYAAQSGIGALAAAIKAGDGAAALAVLEAGDPTAVRRVDPPRESALGAALRAMVPQGFGAYLRRPTPEEQLVGLEHFRILCAHRHGPGGVEMVNAQVEALLAEAGLLRLDGPTYAGRPVMVTRNDYPLELFNGDVGLVYESPEPSARKLVYFQGGEGRLRCLSPSRLPPHETVFAMSIHKSQGSEFDEVAVLLPEQVSPVVSRELLYTAVTRARQRVTVCASRAVVEQAVARRIERASGLRDALWT